MPFDAEWFEELRQLSEDNLQETRARGIDGFVPHVGELCRDGHISGRFLEETLRFVRIMFGTSYRFDTFFRAYQRHVVNFPRGRAFRKQWNIGFTSGGASEDDHVRIGIGFRLSAHEEARGVEEYLEFRQQVAGQQAIFDSTFQAFGNYYEFENWEPPGPFTALAAASPLSTIILADGPPLDGWRFFGKRLWVHEPEDYTIIGSHERLRDAVVEVYNQILAAGFGM